MITTPVTRMVVFSALLGWLGGGASLATEIQHSTPDRDQFGTLQIAQSETPGEKSSAQQRSQQLRPGSASAPKDLQDPENITREKSTTKANTDQQKNACEGCHLVRGLVLSSDSTSLLVRDSAKKEIRLKIDQSTDIGTLSQPRTGTFMEGDRIEAYVRPDGVAWSITALKQQQGQPGVAGAPGD